MDFQREGKNKKNYFEGMLFERPTTREGMNKQKMSSVWDGVLLVLGPGKTNKQENT